MGVDKTTVKNLTIVDIKHDDNLLLVKGAASVL
jgi:large subunit ribosomal protein L3